MKEHMQIDEYEEKKNQYYSTKSESRVKNMFDVTVECHDGLKTCK